MASDQPICQNAEKHTMKKKEEGVGEAMRDSSESPHVAAAAMSSSSSSSRKGKSLANQHIKRPMNGFMVWSSSERKRLAEREPHLHNTELSKRLGEMWRAMSKKEKEPFMDKSKELKVQHKIDHPNYKYRPRRRKDINTLRHSSCLMGPPPPQGPFIPVAPQQQNNYNGFPPPNMTTNQVSPATIGHYSYTNRPAGVSPPSYNFTNNIPTVVRHVPPNAYPHFEQSLHQSTAAVPTPAIIQRVQPPNTVPTHYLSYNQYHQPTDPNAGILTSTACNPIITTNTDSNSVYRDLVLRSVVCSDNKHPADQQIQNQLSYGYPLEYISNVPITTATVKTDQQQVVASCDNPSFATQYTSDKPSTTSQSMPLSVSPAQDRSFRPIQFNTIETPPCSPHVSPNPIQVFSSTLSSNCMETKVCTSAHEKQYLVSSPRIVSVESHNTVHPPAVTCSMITPSPDSIPSTSDDQFPAPDYFTWPQQQVYNGSASSYQIKTEKDCEDPSYQPQYSNGSTYHATDEGKPHMYPTNMEYTSQSQYLGYQHANDEDSIGSNSIGGGPSTLSHDPLPAGPVIRYQSTISGGICDLPTPDLTPTENKPAVLNEERNVFF